MRLTTRSLAFSVACLGLSSLLITPAIAQTDPQVGVWKLNVARSRYSGQAPKSATSKIEAAGKGVKLTVDQVLADDAKRHWEVTANYDGKDTPIVGHHPDADTLARSHVNASTVRTVYKKGGKVTLTQTSEVSSDGKTRTVRTTGVNARGEKVNNVAVYEKQ